MLKEVKILIVSLICLVALGGALCALIFLPQLKNIESNAGSQENVASVLEKIVSYNANDLKTVKIKNETSEFTVEIKKKREESNIYKIFDSNSKEINNDLVEQTAIKNLVTDLLNLTPMQIVEETCEDIKKYGLGSEKICVTLNFKAANKTFILGDEAPLSVGYYLKDKDFENRVYLITEPAAENFLKQLESYLVKAKEG